MIALPAGHILMGEVGLGVIRAFPEPFTNICAISKGARALFVKRHGAWKPASMLTASLIICKRGRVAAPGYESVDAINVAKIKPLGVGESVVTTPYTGR